MIIVGGGVIGTEYACMLAAVGVNVTLVESRPRLLEFVDDEMAESLQFRLRDMGVRLRLGESVAKIERRQTATPSKRRWRATSARAPRRCSTRSAGRARPATLNLAAAGLRRRRSRAVEGQRVFPDRRPAHLRRRRRDRLPGAGRDEHGAGPAGVVPHVRPDRRAAEPRCSPTASTRSPRSAWSGRPSRR